MQIEKFYQAQDLIRQKTAIEAALQKLDNSGNMEKILKELDTDIQATVLETLNAGIRKELTKILKAKEKEFNAL